jgi:hypothetical protein
MLNKPFMVRSFASGIGFAYPVTSATLGEGAQAAFIESGEGCLLIDWSIGFESTGREQDGLKRGGLSRGRPTLWNEKSRLAPAFYCIYSS